jgi:hypothetical protein
VGAQRVYVFAEEKSGGGSRRYIATTIDCLCRRMRKGWSSNQATGRGGGGCGHYYEVLREGEPCHL